jgi:hypothetical protein
VDLDDALGPGRLVEPSMFCVTTPSIRPDCSSRASARWAALGCGSVDQSSRRIRHDSRRIAGSRT